MFLSIFGSFSGWMLLSICKSGPRIALWAGWFVALLILPTWIVKGFGSVTLDLRTGAAVIGIGALLLSSREQIRFKFTLMDLLMIGLLLTHIISAASTGRVSPLAIPEMMRIWLLPYLVGRIFIGSLQDFSKFLPLVAIILVVLSCFAIGEALTKTNVICQALWKYYPVLEAGEGYRWGIKRAQGPLDHPIFFGLTLVMMCPLAVEAANRTLRGQGKKWWLCLPILVLAAVCCTASRGPIISALATVYCTVTFSWKRFRIALILLAIVGGYGGVVLKDKVKQALEASVDTGTFERWIEIDGKEYRYTGTLHRELLFLVYARAIRECPFFGYGTQLRGIPIENHLRQRFSSIDNHYLLFYLQRGVAGLAFFLGITFLALFYLCRIAWDTHLPHSTMAGSMVGALLGVSGLLTTVWFAPDHGTVWLFFVGLATCMWTLRSETASMAKPLFSPGLLQPRLSPGHAPARC